MPGAMALWTWRRTIRCDEVLTRLDVRAGSVIAKSELVSRPRVTNSATTLASRQAVSTLPVTSSTTSVLTTMEI